MNGHASTLPQTKSKCVIWKRGWNIPPWFLYAAHSSDMGVILRLLRWGRHISYPMPNWWKWLTPHQFPSLGAGRTLGVLPRLWSTLPGSPQALPRRDNILLARGHICGRAGVTFLAPRGRVYHLRFRRATRRRRCKHDNRVLRRHLVGDREKATGPYDSAWTYDRGAWRKHHMAKQWRRGQWLMWPSFVSQDPWPQRHLVVLDVHINAHVHTNITTN